jgi:uncharacterized repeat protein (TIGR01451 family)
VMFITKQDGLLQSARRWGALGLVLALAVAFGSDSVTPAQSVTVNAVITVDNVYKLCHGPASPGTITCVGADDNFITVETYTLSPSATDYIYIAAWSDDTFLQGFLGQFSSGSTTIRTGDPGFDVCATGQDLDTLAQQPSPAALATAINQCNTASGWVNPVVGQTAPWLWAGIVGFDPAASGPSAELNKFTPPFPKWIWHDAGQAAQVQIGTGNPAWYGCNGSDRPFNDGCNHQEYLIFRLPVTLLTGGGQTACVQPPSGLVEWWSLDETSGNVVNNLISHPISGHGPDLHNGTPQPGPIGGTGPAPAPGMVAGALQFDGVDDFVEVPDPSGTLSHQAPNSFTIDAWIKVDHGDASGIRPIVDKRVEIGGKVAGYAFFLSNGQLGFQLADGVGPSNICGAPGDATTSCTNYVSTANVADGKWHFVAAVIDRASNQIRLYDGPAGGSLSLVLTGQARPNAGNNAALLIGSGYPIVISKPFFKGAIDEVEIFNRALSEDEIKSIFNAGSAGKCKLQPPSEPTSDLGDAPDSTNHPNKPMTAYPGVPAKFPTVFDPATGLPQGPKHLQPKDLAWLGSDVSFENEADLLPDADGVTNIDPTTPAGIGTPDRDKFDDGVVLPIAIPMFCGQTQFNYTVTSTVAAKLYVNVWFDFNRDGDWDDPIQKCPLGPSTTGSFTEWAVQNELITVVPGPNSFTTPAFGAANPTKGSDMWMRITLTDQPIAPANGADASGPASGYKYGETEDYLLKLQYTELCGIKWNDLNDNGKQDANEPGLAEWTIEVKDANGNFIGFAVTDDQGKYCIVVPSPGTYTVSEQQQAGWTQTAPPTPGTYTVTVPPGRTDLNFGNQQKGKAEICIFKFNDLDGDGKQGPNEPPLAGWQFTVSPAPLPPTTSPVTTGPQGSICFGVTAPGTYTITETVQSGWTVTTPNPRTVTVQPGQLVNVFFGNQQVGKCDLAIKKTVDPNPPVAGQPFAFTVTVTNVGNGPCAPTTTVTDNLPIGFMVTSFNPNTAGGWTCPSGPPGIVCNNPMLTLQPGQSSMVFAVVGTMSPGISIENCAELKNPNDTNPNNNKDCIKVTVVGKCDLKITKTVQPNPVPSGQQVTITLTVQNVGTAPCQPGPFPGTIVRDNKPTGIGSFTLTPATAPPGWQCSLEVPSGNLTCATPNTLPVGYSATFTFTGTVTAPPGSNIQNCATVSNPNDTNPANNQSCVTITVTGGVCDREIKKTVTPNPVPSGGTVTFTLTVTNVGTAACPVVPGINVADPQPSGLTFQPPVSANKPGWSCGISGPSGTWPGGVTCTATSPLLPGPANAVTITFTAKVTAPPGSQIQNCAEVTNVGDAVQTNNKSCVTINVIGLPPPPDLALAKLLDGQLRVEQEATYVLRVTNGGGGPTSGPIVVSDPLPSGLRFVSASGPGWSCAAQGQNVTCRNAGPIQPGQTSTILLRVRVAAPAGTQITNCATVETAGDANPANNRACHTGTVQR